MLLMYFQTKKSFGILIDENNVIVPIDILSIKGKTFSKNEINFRIVKDNEKVDLFIKIHDKKEFKYQGSIDKNDLNNFIIFLSRHNWIVDVC